MKNMDLERHQTKTPADYNRIAQLTERGVSSDFKNFLSFTIPFETFALLMSNKKYSDAQRLFNIIVADLKKTPTYSERYLNERQFRQASEYGVKKEDLINSKTELVIQRLDQMAIRCREIGTNINQQNYLDFVKELEQLYKEARALITGR